MRIRIARGFWSSRIGLGVLGVAFLLFATAAGIFAYYYIHFGRIIDERLTGQVFQNTSRIYTAPRKIFLGEPLRPADVSSYLLTAGYSESEVPGSPGRYKVDGSVIEIHPSSHSYFSPNDALRIEFMGGGVSKLVSLKEGTLVGTAELEPQLITNLFDSSREKRRVVRFDDLPPNLVNALLAAEDKRFFEHPGFDPFRILGAAWADVRHNGVTQGASTLDMQLARSFFFSTKREWKRKVKETLVALELEQRFTKKQIFELYANEIYLGNRGSFSIRGFGEGAEAYFGKDVRNLSVGEAAFLTGIIRAPNRYSLAERHPDRAIEARERVLTQMVEDGFLTAQQGADARKEKLKFAGGSTVTSAAPYFVDMVKEHLLEHFSETDLTSQSYRIYTTLDPQLQRAAAEAVDFGAKNVDTLLARRYAVWKKKGQPLVRPQIAIVVLDPKTGEILALVGGRNYGESQLNHALAHRQPGSVFKPFVYAAAFDNAVDGLQPIVTPVTTVDDEPTTFEFDGKEYTPNNYGEEFFGPVTVRDALIHSLNVATVKVAEMVGFKRVADVAHQMGLASTIQATPAVALGAYEMTPVEVAAGYTIFANNGLRAEPMFLTNVVASDGSELERTTPKTRPVLDPRVAYLVTSLMQDVINRGTGATVRARGFTAPAAGKTGTSRDGWFAGFTSNLVCVVWVGFDDNRDLGLSGTNAAAPIWAELMKRAIALPEYHQVRPLDPPPGITEAMVDPQSGELATPACPNPREEVFVAGTEPTQFCAVHGNGMAMQAPPVAWLAHLFGKREPEPPPGSTPAGQKANGTNGPPPVTLQAADPEAEKKKGLLHKIFGIFGNSKKAQEPPKPEP